MMIDGKEIQKGEIVHFKSDVEQCGIVERIGGNFLVLKARDESGFDGDYIGGGMFVERHKSDCWLE